MKKLLIFAAALLLCFAVSATAAENTYTGTVAPINVNTPGEHTVILNGVTIDAVDTPAINVEAPATKLTIVLKNGTTNTLTGGEYQVDTTSSTGFFSTVGEAAIANKGVTLVIRCESAGEGHVCTASCGKLIANGGAYSAGIGGCSSQPFDDDDVIYDRGDEAMKGTVTVMGGNIIATGGYQAAGIGGGNGGDLEGTLLISGGNIESVGPMSGAGIGGGCSGAVGKNASIIITGGNVTAKSVNAAGIGAGMVEESVGIAGSVLISGGTVNAEGGRYAAGIGTGAMGKITGSITISGGTVNAKGGPVGAGIGLGATSDGVMSGSITITGGAITAVGGEGAAGIGGEEGRISGTVTIAGGTVKAVGGKNAAGIGCGENAQFTGSLTITGGNVHAVGGENSVGIGVNGEKGKMSGTITVSGGTVTAVGNGADAVGAGNGCEMSEESSILVAPTGGEMAVKAGADQNSALAVEGSPFADKADITALLKGKHYAHFEKAVPVPQLPVTGDSMNVAFFAVLAAAGMICMALLLRRKNEA